MRNLLSLVFLVATLMLVTPAEAQWRDFATDHEAPVKLYDTGKSGFSLNALFSPKHFKMGQSIEFSSGSYLGQNTSVGMYTNTLMWQFDKIAARVDISAAYSPNAGNALNSTQAGGLGNNTRVFVRNAEIAYKPTENMELHISFRQSPYGMYASPYGRYGYNPYYGGGGRFMRASFGGSDHLFWDD